MIKELYKKNAISLTWLLVCHYKEIDINEAQLIVLLLLIQLCREENRVYVSSEISPYTNYSTKEIDEIFDSLILKKYIKIKSIKNAYQEMDFNYLFERIVKKIDDKLNENSILNEIVDFILKHHKVVLSKNEKKQIDLILKSGISKTIIIDELALENKISKGSDVIKMLKKLELKFMK